MITNLHLTKHATQRIQHRAIPEKIINWLLEFGHRVNQTGKHQIYHFHRRDRKKIIDKLNEKEGRLFNKKRYAYLVLANENRLITAGYRNKRLPRC
ncbi:hypothetical protein SAMN02746065_1614 [Desulfocicer vacuolatum DSM 3385]|uniref:DUF4258 domain-containing protein n=1 Tax=Desulfocicer vacuolatum DSM 3385 TaxID=1121400 RepID=A0A1W2EZ77_9BACT|nr:hypothetical protein [Desulfocicer vacuolatum]SMD14960.1 hypothetical protein SAMN02746065_1614 [Desulfocicer vacuolatum DSM 3385]